MKQRELAKLITEIILENYDEIVAAHDDGKIQEITDLVDDTLENCF